MHQRLRGVVNQGGHTVHPSLAHATRAQFELRARLDRELRVAEAAVLDLLGLDRLMLHAFRARLRADDAAPQELCPDGLVDPLPPDRLLRHPLRAEDPMALGQPQRDRDPAAGVGTPLGAGGRLILGLSEARRMVARARARHSALLMARPPAHSRYERAIVAERLQQRPLRASLVDPAVPFRNAPLVLPAIGSEGLLTQPDSDDDSANLAETPGFLLGDVEEDDDDDERPATPPTPVADDRRDEPNSLRAARRRRTGARLPARAAEFF
jgi:hypothetical protein